VLCFGGICLVEKFIFKTIINKVYSAFGAVGTPIK
jgi:hypothetical protein